MRPLDEFPLVLRHETLCSVAPATRPAPCKLRRTAAQSKRGIYSASFCRERWTFTNPSTRRSTGGSKRGPPLRQLPAQRLLQRKVQQGYPLYPEVDERFMIDRSSTSWAPRPASGPRHAMTVERLQHMARLTHIFLHVTQQPRWHLQFIYYFLTAFATFFPKLCTSLFAIYTSSFTRC